MGFLEITLPLLFLPHMQTGKSWGQIQGFSLVLNRFFTILSSSEWKVMICLLYTSAYAGTRPLVRHFSNLI